MRPVAFADQVERFRGDVAAVLGRVVAPADILAIAVSGGPDSMALLALAHAVWPGRVIAATVDHGLRAAAVDEAAMVAEFCAALPTPLRRPGLAPGPGVTEGEGVPHATLRPTEPLGIGNIQATARAARYALLTDWATTNGATLLATAHHADDQAETFLMRAARGSGLAGLSGIRSRRDLPALPLIRPLLGWRRAELRDLVAANGIPFVDDPSNEDDHYDRTRFRRLLGDNAWLDPVGLARTADYAREGQQALEAMIDWLWRERQVTSAEQRNCSICLDLDGCPREIKRRLARRAIDGVRHASDLTRPAFSSATNIEHLLDAVEAGTAATQGGVLVSRRGDIWQFRAAPPRRDTSTSQS